MNLPHQIGPHRAFVSAPMLSGVVRTGEASIDEDPCDDPYNDEQDHLRCTDCKGSGWYVGFTERRHCPTCDGAGYV